MLIAELCFFFSPHVRFTFSVPVQSQSQLSLRNASIAKCLSVALTGIQQMVHTSFVIIPITPVALNRRCTQNLSGIISRSLEKLMHAPLCAMPQGARGVLPF